MPDEERLDPGRLARGTRLKGRYRLERLLGRGGMASVWLADDEVLDRPVAIKVLSDTIASDPEFLARFRREARVAANVSHPNLIGVYDYAEGGERPYLVMEYVPGDNLAERRARNVAIDGERLARELLGALAHIHAAGIVHRDVKPQNVLLAPDGSAKLIDFGIALPRDATALTRTGNLLGTARYIAPETMHGQPATERSDLYSCGIVLRDCIDNESPRHLRALVERLASEDPRGRPGSAKEALAELDRAPPAPDLPSERFEPTQRFDVLDPVAPAPAPNRSQPSKARLPWGKATAVLAALAISGAALLIVTNGTEESGGGGGRGDATVATSERDDGRATADREAGGEEADEEPEEAPEVPAPTGSDAALGSALNQEGFELIQAGSYEEAVPVLEEAVRAFPPETEDLDYAYALFNLGNALRLSGRPEEAIPVLERRLEIPNQTGVVREELAAAEAESES